MEGTIGEIRGFAGNFAPRTWAFCSGGLLAISSNTALFSILGTTYGGDGRTTFGLPDLRGRIPMNVGSNHTGQGPGLSPVTLGQMGGIENATMTLTEMPVHHHIGVINVKSGDGAKRQATNNILSGDATTSIYSNEVPDGNLNLSSMTTNATGSGNNFSIRNPYLGINMIICLQGVFPSRN